MTLVIVLVVAAYAIVSGVLALLFERRAARRGARTWRRWPVVNGLVGIGLGVAMIVIVVIAAGQKAIS
jgi:uncharacterized membrane protein HdeD (DUF308 family)